MGNMNIIKAESFDVMQYFYGNVHNPIIHCLVSFSGNLNVEILKKAVTLSKQTIPLIGCCFDIDAWRPCWRRQGFTGEDIVHVIQSDCNGKEQSERLFASTIDIMHEPQLKIYLIKGQDLDTLCILMNHMVCDGSGFKEYLYLLGSLYSKLREDENYTPDSVACSRGTGQLFSEFGIRDKIKILFSKYDLSKQRHQAGLCLKGDKDNPFFVTRCIGKEDFTFIKAYARSEGSTINDAVLTAYIRLLSKKTGKDRVVMPCPMDLRKYLNHNRKHGICNLTSNFICDVIVGENDSFKDTLSQVSKQMKIQKMSIGCLKSVVMLEFVFHALPFKVIQGVFHNIFTIPVISFTNLGIIDKKLLRFGDTGIEDVYITGAVKYVPYFQIAISTYDDRCTISCNLHGTNQDRQWIEGFLEELSKELLDQS
jgi:Uncharacterized protein containing a NRPS condensation (elongation) domain